VLRKKGLSLLAVAAVSFHVLVVLIKSTGYGQVAIASVFMGNQNRHDLVRSIQNGLARQHHNDCFIDRDPCADSQAFPDGRDSESLPAQ
jgi:hypothetical protein